jgi:heme-degrading monooxygenase HmoA
VATKLLSVTGTVIKTISVSEPYSLRFEFQLEFLELLTDGSSTPRIRRMRCRRSKVVESADQPDAEDIIMRDAIISAEPGHMTFVQIWRVSSEDHQRRLLETMHSRVGFLTKQPGFISMTLHASLDGKQTATYAQWTDEASFMEAIGLPEAKRNHDEMTQWGTSEGTLYRVDSVYLPDAISKR